MGKLSARCAAIGKHSEDYERAMGEVEPFLRARSRWLDFTAIENLEKHGFAMKLSIRFRVEWT
jgi:hypothetical protein